MLSASLNRHPCLAAAFAAAALSLFAAVTLAADYIDLRRVEPVRDGDAAAGKDKAAVCVACHGADGISPAPIFPNLRGQTTEYLYWALIDFKRGKREASPMTPLVAQLGDQDLRDLAAFYAQAGNAPLAAAATTAPGDDPALRTRGEQLYLRGDAALGIPPCQGCHGVNGDGHPLAHQAGVHGNAAHLTYPALRAQKQDYLVAKLAEYRDNQLTDSTNDFIMAGVARHLDQESGRAIAAWLSGLQP